MRITNHMTRQRKTPAAMTAVAVVAAAAFIPPKASILPGTAWPAAPASAVRASAIPDRIT